MNSIMDIKFQLILVTLLYSVFLASAVEYYMRQSQGLTSMPTNIPTTATHVILTNNSITEVPTSTWTPFHNDVRWLSLHENLLTSFPDLRKLGSCLVAIGLDYNLISYINETYLEGLDKLFSLALHGNQLVGFPESVALNSLNLFSISDNYLTEPPNFSAFAKNLLGIAIAKNNISSFNPAVFSDVPDMYSINAQENAFTSIPDFGNLNSSLITLRLDSTPTLTHAGVAEMAALTQLTFLNISYTGLTLLPSSCPVKPDKLGLLATGTPLQMCDCQMAWLKVRRIKSMHQSADFILKE